MNGKDKERSFSEVGDTLRYFNSMATSHSWCCTEYDNSSSSAMALIGLKKLEEAAMAKATAEAIAIAAAVSGDTLSDDDGGVFIMPNDLKVQDTNLKNRSNNDQQCPNNQLILPWHSNDPPSSKPVSILLTAPSADPSEFPKPCLENEHINISNQALSVLSDPSQMRTIHNPSNSELSVVPRRASDDSKYYRGRNNLQVVNLTDNPFIQQSHHQREASDGVLALRADRERQRRHSTCPAPSRNQMFGGSSKSFKDWFQSFSSSQRASLSWEASSIFGLERPKDRPQPPTLVPEVVVSHHSSENLFGEDEDICRELANRDFMAKTVQKHLTLDDVKTPLKDKLFTASLLALTMMGILVLFWYQNFGPGFKAFIRHYDTSDSANKT